MEQVRSFIAIELPNRLRLEIGKLEQKLEEAAPPRTKWIKSQSIHLTLKFLGNVAIDRIDEITKAISEVAMQTSPFQLTVSDIGVFPNLGRPQVIWVGICDVTNKLRYLHKQIESNLIHLGFASESRRFTPHLTLARLQNQVSPEERQKFGKFIANTRFKAINKIKVDSISLMRSILTKEEAIYTRINKICLK